MIPLDASGHPLVPPHQDAAVLADFLAATPRVPPVHAAPTADPPVETSRAVGGNGSGLLSWPAIAAGAGLAAAVLITYRRLRRQAQS